MSAYVSPEDVARYAAWAAEDAERLEAQLRAARKVTRLAARHAEARALSDRWDAWMACPVCQPWRQLDASGGHTCETTVEERRGLAALDISKHGDKLDRLARQVGEAHRELLEARR